MKVALVHDWLIHMRGGEKVLDALAELYPEATIYTLFCDRKNISSRLASLEIKTSFLQYFPGIKSYYRWLLPIFPWAIRSVKIGEADLVISSSHCVAKGIRVPENAFHVCYCHTPMRYLWGFQDVYFNRTLAPVRFLINGALHFLRRWDLGTNSRVDLFVANSYYIKKRIKTVYQRDAVVVYPPLDTEFFIAKDRSQLEFGVPRETAGGTCDFYLAVSHFVPYKRLDPVIEAFNGLERRLVIIGSGPLASYYQKLRKSERISFWGGVSDEELLKAYSEARALVFPTEEDFGIVPLEAQACGTPVIAFRKGGALETVKSGVFFDAQTPEAIRSAVLRFEGQRFDPQEVAGKVQEFGREHFLAVMKKTIDSHYTVRGVTA